MGLKRARLGSATAKLTSVPAPTLGWNARDGVAAMEQGFAPLLDNFFPDRGEVRLRGGSADWATGLGATVETLMTYAAGSAETMFAAAGGKIFDVSAAGAVGAAAVSGLANNRWQHVNFGTAGGQFLYAVNGQDDPRLYDGSTWRAVNATSAPIAITGVTAANLVHVAAYRQRLFFVEKNTLKAWYLPVNSVGGAANALDLSALATKGGFLLAVFTLTYDGGNGPNEFLVFLTSAGQALIFSGADPSNASAWSYIGRYDMGRPAGRRCFLHFGADVIVLTEDGYLSLVQVRATGVERASAKPISDVINPVARAAVRDMGTSFGWQPIYHPAGSMLLINVPTAELARAQQHVMNTATGAWCRFTGWNAVCLATFQGKLYFGMPGGIVRQADTGASDQGSNITGDLLTAWSDFGAPGLRKQFTLLRPLMSTMDVQPALQVGIDFNTAAPRNTPTAAPSGGSPWDTSPWNSSPWSPEAAPKNALLGAGGLGSYGGVRLQVNANNSPFSVSGFDVAFRVGGFL